MKFVFIILFALISQFSFATCSLFLPLEVTKGCSDLDESTGMEAAKSILESKGYNIVTDESSSRFKIISGFACIEYEEGKGPGPFNRNMYSIKLTDRLNDSFQNFVGSTMYFIKDHEIRSLKKAFNKIPECTI